MKIRLALKHDKEAWDCYLDKFPEIPPLNHYDWKEILEKCYRVETPFFIASNERNEICGLLPTYIIRDLKGKKRLYSLRYGCIADNSDMRKELLLYVRTFCQQNNIGSGLITTGYNPIERDQKGLVKKTVIARLAHDEESTWKSLKDKTRNMIRKAIKSNITAEKGLHNLKEFYNIYSSNMLEKGISIHSYQFFEDMHAKMKGKAELIVAKKEEKVIAGILLLFSGSTALYPFQSSLRSYRRFAPNDFLIWEAIRSCLHKGIYKLDMGESREEGPTYRFKTNFGGSPRDIYYYSVSLSKRKGIKKGWRRQRSLASEVLVRSPFLLRRKMALWIKRRERII